MKIRKCRCVEPAENDITVTFCGRCGNVVDDGNAEENIGYLTKVLKLVKHDK